MKIHDTSFIITDINMYASAIIDRLRSRESNLCRLVNKMLRKHRLTSNE